MDQAITAEQHPVEIQLSVRAAGSHARDSEKPGDAAQSVGEQDWLALLSKATCEIFEVMLGTSLTVSPEPRPQVIPDFAAMVGIAGGLCGLVSIRTTADVARQIAAKMLGDEAGAAEAAPDAFGEVCNMIAGSFKGRIEGLSDVCALSVPTVIFGKDFTMFSLARGRHFELNFLFEGGNLTVSFGLHA